jgi:Flp pilus assembly pilin Flp
MIVATERRRRCGHADQLGRYLDVTTNLIPHRFDGLVCSTEASPSGHSRNTVSAHSGCGNRGREVNPLTSFFTYLDALRKREDGQTMAEYGVVLAVITLGVVLALGILSGAISDAINSVVSFL